MKSDQINKWVSERRGRDLSKFHFGAVFLIFFAIAVSYGDTLSYPFHFDDMRIFVDNYSLHVKNLSWDALSPVFSSNRPAANMTYALNFYFNRLDPRGYHLVNVLIHFLTALLVYILFLKTLSMIKIEPVFSNEKIALLGALLWAVHPIQTQAVTYVVQRMASLAAFFYLFSLVSYIQGRRSQKMVSWAWFFVSGLSALLAFGTKENSLALPLMIFLYELFFISRFDLPAFRKQIVIFLFLIIGIALGSAWILERFTGSISLAGIPAIFSAQYGAGEMDPLLRVMTEWRVLMLYLSLLIFPRPARMNLDYDFPLSSSLFNPVSTLFSLLGILFLLGFALWKAKKYPLLSFSILWFFINLAIESTFIKLDLVFEHRLYLPSVMFFLLFVTGMDSMFRRLTRHRYQLFLWIGPLLIGVLMFATYERNKVWKTPLSLWSDVTEKSPNKARGFNNLGKAYRDAEQWGQAKSTFEKAVSLDPKNQEALNNLGNMYRREGNLKEAIKYYQEILELNKDNPSAHNNFGVVLRDFGRYDLALQEFKEAIRINPGFTDAHNNAGNIYLQANQLDLALLEYQKTAELNPKHPLVHTNLGVVYLKQGNLDKAFPELELGLSLNPRELLPHFLLGYALEMKGQKDQAVEHYTEALKWALPQNKVHVEMINKRLMMLKGLPSS